MCSHTPYVYFDSRDDYDDWSKAPEGIYCQRPDIFRRRLPELPEQFSVAIESVDEVRMKFTDYALTGYSIIMRIKYNLILIL